MHEMTGTKPLRHQSVGDVLDVRQRKIVHCPLAVGDDKPPAKVIACIGTRHFGIGIDIDTTISPFITDRHDGKRFRVGKRGIAPRPEFTNPVSDHRNIFSMGIHKYRGGQFMYSRTSGSVGISVENHIGAQLERHEIALELHGRIHRPVIVHISGDNLEVFLRPHTLAVRYDAVASLQQYAENVLSFRVLSRQDDVFSRFRLFFVHIFSTELRRLSSR